MEFLDFDLALGPQYGDDTFALTLVHSPVGYAFDVLRLEREQLLLLNPLIAKGDDLASIGQMLFVALMNGTVGDAYYDSRAFAERQGKGLRIVLRFIEPELAVYPWELLYDPRHREFLGLSPKSSVIRTMNFPPPLPPPAFVPPLRVLGMVASPSRPSNDYDLTVLDVETEKAQVEDGLKKLIDAKLVEVSWLETNSLRELQSALRQGGGPWHIFHFVGHGSIRRNTGEGFVFLWDESDRVTFVSGAKLGVLLASHSHMRLVMLVTAHGAAGNASTSSGSIAPTLTNQGVPAVIAFRDKVSIADADLFVRSWYESVANGVSIEAACTDARVTLDIESGTASWTLPALYCRSPAAALFATIVESAAKQVEDGASVTGEVEFPLHLTGRQFRELQNALLSAFNSKTLPQMVRIRLDEYLERIAGGADNETSDTVFNLIRWAEEKGKMQELIQGALLENPSDPDLRAFVDSLNTV